MTAERVLVTGASGFVAKHIIARLLVAGFAVRGTLRAPNKAEGIRAAIAGFNGADPGDRLDFATADLLDDTGWVEAMEGISEVVHTAMVVLGAEPKRRADVVRPGIEGTERVMTMAARAGVRRVVLTGSIAAIGYGRPDEPREVTYGPDDWTDADAPGLWAYAEAKTRGERAAWRIADAEGMGLTTVLAGMVLGPVTDPDTSVSVGAVSRLLDGTAPAIPDMGYNVVDVRDLADIHVNAVLNPGSAGRRVVAAAEYLPLKHIADVLREAYPAHKVTRRVAPSWMLRPLSLFVPELKMIRDDIGVVKRFDGASGQALLGRDYRSARETVLDSAESLFALGMLERL